MSEIRGGGEVADVETLDGVRVLLDEEARPFVEYLVKWKVNIDGCSDQICLYKTLQADMLVVHTDTVLNLCSISYTLL